MRLSIRRAIRNRIPKGNEGDAIRQRIGDDSVCTRCGKCCHQGFLVKGRFIFVPELPCRYLERNDDGTYACSVYDKRHRVPWCHAVSEETLSRGLFPADCGYVQGIPKYRGKELMQPADQETVRRHLVKFLRDYPRPRWIRADKWDEFKQRLFTDEFGLVDGEWTCVKSADSTR